MFELIESCPERRASMGWTGRVVSALIHIFVLSAAVAATRSVVEAVEPYIITDRGTIWETRPQLVPAGGSGGHRAPLTIPVNVPTDIPPPGDVPIDVPPAWDPVSSACETCIDPGPQAPLDPGGTAVINPQTVHDARIVDERPELLSHPELRYPPALRQAGIEGRVMIEAVLDTLGRAEPAQARVVSSPHPMFDTEALEVVMASQFRPARVNGRAVRVRIRLPISFEIRR